jgi:hypothetical protein
VLYVGIKNKYCRICETSAKLKKNAPSHKCFKNWKNTSTSMEIAIILEGFQNSVAMHNLKYTKIIGDGDSREIKESMRYGPHCSIEKIECKNHIMRNYSYKTF